MITEEQCSIQGRYNCAPQKFNVYLGNAYNAGTGNHSRDNLIQIDITIQESSHIALDVRLHNDEDIDWFSYNRDVSSEEIIEIFWAK